MKSSAFNFLFLFILINFTQSQTADCNKVPFYPADHIRNPSLESTESFCTFKLGADSGSIHSILMSKFIPFWQLPIRNAFTVEYFGVCNNFYHAVDPVAEADPRTTLVRNPLVPQPIPSGKSVIGLESQRSRTGTPFEERLTGKDYISTNLLRVLKKDSLYRLDFALGFGARQEVGEGFNISSSPVRFALFGLMDSTKIPFVNPSPGQLLGCLTARFPDWVELGSVVITGDQGTWQRGVIDFVAPKEIQTIAIGSGCDFSDIPFVPRAADEYTDYYFIDDLKFFQASVSKPAIGTAGGRYCSGDSIRFRIVSNNSFSGSGIQWYRNNIPIPEHGAQVTVNETNYGEGWYKFRIQNDSLCMMSDSLYAHWEPELKAGFADNDTTLCQGDTMTLKMSGSNTTTYLWSDRSTDSSIIITKAGLYYVRASNGCNSIYASKNVAFRECHPTVYIPTAFTPNSDGLNDLFRVNVAGRVKSFSLVVYDRFGQRVFVSKDPAKGWDGTIKYKKQNTGLYVWMLQYTDGSGASFSQQGTVTLIR